MRNNEQGRSMIEMLGVLAIVGVLSVGGIAGYSKAMGKFKTNKAIDQINMLTTNIRTLYSSQRNYNGLTTELAKKVNLVPAEMYSDVSDSKITNAFGGSLEISVSAASTEGDEKAFILEMDNVPSSACVSIVTTDWGSDSDGGLIAFGTADPDEVYIGSTGEDNIHVPGGDDEHSIPYNVTQTSTECGNNTNVTLYWKYM